MTDRELLELAAKAVELPECGWMGPAFMYVKDNTFTDWNPLTDDGDALRLAVKLHIDLTFYPNPQVNDPWVMAATGDVAEDEPFHGDPLAATRRAIVRAAAEIGRKMT